MGNHRSPTLETQGRKMMTKVVVVGVNGGTRVVNSCVNAFEELGCNVTEYDYYKKFLNKRHFFLPYLGDITEKANYIRINKELIGISKKFKPNFILLIKCNPIFPSTIKFVQNKLNIRRCP